MSGLPSMLEQTMRCTMSTELEPPIFNAGHFLPGVRSGSVTSRVLAALQAKHP